MSVETPTHLPPVFMRSVVSRLRAVRNAGSGDSFKARFFRGSALATIAYGATQCVRLSSSLVLTRLLLPEAFGLMAIVTACMQGLSMFSDLGIGPSIIQNRGGDDPKFLNTAWTLQVIRGATLCLVTCLLSRPAAVLYEEPLLRQLLPVAGCSAIIAGFASTKIFTAHRHMQLGRVTCIELVSQVLGLLLMAGLALLWRSVWALLIGGLVSQLIKTWLSHAIIPGVINRLCLDRDSLRRLSTFGIWLFASTCLTFVAQQSDRLILGAITTMAFLGVYSIALNLANTVRDLATLICRTALVPAVARYQDLPRAELRDKLARYRRPMLFVYALAMGILTGVGDLAIYLLYSDSYRGAGVLLQILLLGRWIRVLDTSLGPSLLALGNPRYNTASAFFQFIFMCAAYPAGWYVLQETGLVIANSLLAVPAYIVFAVGLYRNRISLFGQDVKFTILYLITAALAWGLSRPLLSISGIAPDV